MVIHAIIIELNSISFLVHLQISMLKTLERYQKCSYGAVEVSKPAKELEV